MIAKEGRDTPGAPGCLPSRKQRLLLQAACLPAVDAEAAWVRWRHLSDLRSIDPVSARILPWIYTRRAELNVSEADLAILEPGYRFAWLKNQRLLNCAEATVLALRKEGIEAILLKGLPLLVDAYGDVGGRYMEDFDLLLPEDRVEHAVAALAHSGWTPLHRDAFAESTRRWRHSNEVVHEIGLQCDIHWRLMRRPYRPVSEDPIWNGKREITVRSTRAYAPAVEHTLLHLMVHGMSWQRVPPIRWILDTHLLLEKYRPDWDVILTEAQRRGVVTAMREALTCYASLVPGEVPDEILERAYQLPISREQALAYQQIAGPYHEMPPRVRWAIYKTSLAEAQTRKRIASGFRGAFAHFYDYWLGKLIARVRRNASMKSDRA